MLDMSSEVSEPQRTMESKGIEWKMEFAEFPAESKKLMEVREISSSRPTERVNFKNRPERAVFTPQNLNQVAHTKNADGEGHSNRRGLNKSQITKQVTISRSLHYPKLAVKFTESLRQSCLAPGTGVYYMPRRSVTTKGYGKVCTVEALSLLADVSCKMKRTHQRSSNIAPKFSENDAHKEFFNQMPSRKGTGPAQKVFPRSYCKEHFTDQNSTKMALLPAKENLCKVVRKLRTPRRTSQSVFRCPTKLQKNVILSKCDEFFFLIGASRSLSGGGRLRDRLVKNDTAEITSANKEVIAEGKFSYDKSVSNIEVPQASQVLSKSSCQPSGTKKKAFRGFKRAERFANRILHFIGEMTVPERLIRQALGNNPDTSKALRLLLTERKLTRLGTGGRGRAYEYAATEKGLLQLRRLEQAVSELVELTPESETASSCNPLAGASIFLDARKSETKCVENKDMMNPGIQQQTRMRDGLTR